MLSTGRLLQHACRITLFTRANCSLCDNAKLVLSNVWGKRPFEFAEIDVMASEQQRWKDLYEFDTPVVHIDKTPPNAGRLRTSPAARKLMHRFSEEQLDKLMDEAERETASRPS